MFYSSLARIACLSQIEAVPQQAELQNIHECLAKLKHWAKYAPMNYQHKCDLIEAELAKYDRQWLVAIELYDRAISGAKAHEYLQEEALANELAAQFYLNWGKEKIAQTYMIEAYYYYARWGAKAKTDRLEQTYPQLLAPILQQQQSPFDPNTTLAWNSSQTAASQSITQIASTLDFATVLKVSQAISEEIQLESLLSTLMQVAIENAGADKGVLILSESGDWVV